MTKHFIFFNRAILFLFLISLAATLTLNPASASTENLPQLKDFTAKNIKTNMDVNMVFHEEKPYFTLDPVVLNRGDVQGYIDFVYKEELPEYYKKFNVLMQKIDKLGIMDAPGDRLSITKLVFIIPKVKANKFSVDVMIDAAYAAATNKGIAVLDPVYGKNNLRFSKRIPVIKDAVVEYQLKESTLEKPEKNTIDATIVAAINSAINPEFGPAARINIAEQVDTNYTLMTKVVSIYQYFDLVDDSGVLVVNHTIASLDYDELGRIARAVFERIPASTRINTFIEEGIYTAEGNRSFF
ncbi:MAG: hypothetical protein HQK49_18150 [Oligoflexia bacterium]|nr:hypothetical protein [Oligoflexia bacterium]